MSLEVAEALEERIADLTEDMNDEEGFHFGELERLAGVRLQDLRNYFQDQQICSCDDRYRREFPRYCSGTPGDAIRRSGHAPFDAVSRTTGAICSRSCAT